MKHKLTFIGLRFVIPSLLSSALFAAALFLVFPPIMESAILRQKRMSCRDLTQSAWSVLSAFEEKERKGQLSREEAQRQAAAQIQALRYGPERKDYFWINDRQPRMIVHPYRPDLNGKDLSGFTDPTGKHLFLEFVKVVQEKGEGYVDYMWQWKDDPSRIVPKISYVMDFTPWQWIVGTGIYIEDVRAELFHLKLYLGGVCLVILFIAILINGYLGWQGIQSDAGRRRAEEERWRLAKAIEQGAEAVLISSVQGEVQYVNPAFEKMSGYSRNEIVGRSVCSFASGDIDESFISMMDGALHQGKIGVGRLKNQRKDGAFYEADASVSPIQDNGGAIAGCIAVMRDVTHEAALERQLRQSQKLEALGSLAGGIAHDFNNILSVVNGFTELALEEPLPPDGKIRHHLEQIFKACQRAKDLVAQILTFSRHHEQEKQAIHLTPIVKESLKMLRASLPSTIEIRKTFSAAADIVMADATQIHRVVVNLCANAAHAMREHGGLLEISLDEIRMDEATADINYPPPGDYLRLTVRDNGEGIEPAALDRIFDPFFTTKTTGEGTGLGLSLVHGIIKSFDGAIRVESKVGKGSSFFVYLPQWKNETAVAAKTEMSISGGNERILFVDDEEALREIGRQTLERLGYQVAACADGAEALEIFQQENGAFDLIVTDMTMPKMTGMELAKEILRLRPEFPIILCTGFSEMASPEEAQKQGVRELMMKPYRKQEIAARIRRVLDSR